MFLGVWKSGLLKVQYFQYKGENQVRNSGRRPAFICKHERFSSKSLILSQINCLVSGHSHMCMDMFVSACEV